jgi:hypothetical protein
MSPDSSCRASELGVKIMANFSSGELVGERIQHLARTIKDMKGIFRDEKARQSLSQDAVVYRIQAVYPAHEGEEGGLFWGTTFIEPGMVGDEYFMTKGHFHANRGRGEYYMTVTGRGALILMDESRRTTLEYVPCDPTLHPCKHSPSGGEYRRVGAGILGLLAERCRTRLRCDCIDGV